MGSTYNEEQTQGRSIFGKTELAPLKEFSLCGRLI